jgi:Fe-S-cluster-containing hydrogenase component 2
MGFKIEKNIENLENLARIMKSKPPAPIESKLIEKNDGIFPLFHCNQEIPCNPCTTVCPQDQIKTSDDIITALPYFKEEKDCIGCGKCIAICPGLAVTLIDFRKNKEFPSVTIPLELSVDKIEKGEKIQIVSNDIELGEFDVKRVRVLPEYPKTQLITVEIPSKIAKSATGIKLHKSSFNEPLESYDVHHTDNEIIICRCERVSVGEIRYWIRQGVRDFNELKALTKVGMGSCSGKTCTPLIDRIFREEGVSTKEITPGTKRPLFIEIPMGLFAGIKVKKR